MGVRTAILGSTLRFLFSFGICKWPKKWINQIAVSCLKAQMYPVVFHIDRTQLSVILGILLQVCYIYVSEKSDMLMKIWELLFIYRYVGENLRIIVKVFMDLTTTLTVMTTTTKISKSIFSPKISKNCQNYNNKEKSPSKFREIVKLLNLQN
jgi:hypothetical protein